MKNLIKKFILSLIVFGASLLTPVFAHAAEYYMSPIGNDNNSGSINSPFASISKAQAVASYGDTVFIMGGTYKNFNIASSDNTYNYVNNITKSGITYRAFSSSDIPVFDFSTVPTNKRVAAFHIAKGVTDVTIATIDVTGVKVGNQKQSECFRVEGNALLYEVTCHDTEANGFYFVNNGTGYCTKCDAYNNIGATKFSIGNTDGFGAHGNGVVFQYCRSWNNSDDGFDCLTSKGTNTFDHCWAFNMNAGGDSNGFKIGGYASGTPYDPVPVHTVYACLAANNKAHGFYANHQPGQSAYWYNNTAYNNRGGNFDMLERVSINDPTDIPGTREIVHNNLSFNGIAIKDSNLPSKNVISNSWNIEGITVTASDFQSLDISELTKKRDYTNSDELIPDVKFMHLVNGSDLKGLGCF
ncbi:right-handed parallel beta-helix repeat-containing protein [Clostridium cibarium]|uniref:Pectate lyase n=1 Tax=Clostridium cibarium TaxID=2762247 RepID=A0ABR8PTM1_9CLOT|nr:pectate lyase [Clostridium cibarium]MBD7911523.1 pectate lyase [Clostridium cibarium]